MDLDHASLGQGRALMLLMLLMLLMPLRRGQPLRPRPLSVPVTRLARIAATLALVGWVSACDPERAIRIEPSAPARLPVFVLIDTGARAVGQVLYGLSVVRCGTDSAIWTIAATGSPSATGLAGSPGRVTYGETPPGYVSSVGPGRLVPGCYDVYASGGERGRFRIGVDGGVVGGQGPNERGVGRPDAAAPSPSLSPSVSP